ncbi:MAG TPA: ATP-binding protein [Saprospiraceae bacterium]|nr:ATP-binding protein [Saprospiraceae bacterium]HRJ13786.1 ATP-binding protein [Saprospiraceae bacterium]HRK82611.1 ATP-binding protein [Saprospiraceae bacterium]
MEYLKRSIEPLIKEYLLPNKVLVLLGPRRVGKTVLLRQILSEITEPFLLLNGEDINTKELFNRRSLPHFLQLLDGKKLLIIDEAQKIPDIGHALKLMIDEIVGLRILITGSSAFDVENFTGEPLTGRKFTFKLFALSEAEYDQRDSILIRKDKLRERLVYGNYPELLQLQTTEQKNRYLNDLVSSYLLKDILTFESIKNSDKILALLRLLAFQTGSEVSTTEIGKQLSMSSNTVSRYLDLLSKVFIIHRVGGFSRNLRKEISKSSKWYFFDNGIRNILVANLNPIDLRNDAGQLWENYIISERIKFQQNTGMIVNNYFWRTYDQQEIDWIEERGGDLHGYEFKWNEKKQPKAPGGWKEGYPDASYQVLTPENYADWVRNDLPYISTSI